jgi:hypothetical protein
MGKLKILITVEGGIVQSICTNVDADIVVIDYDDKSDDPVLVSEILSPDSITDGLMHVELFKGDLHSSEKIAQEQLKDLNF